MKRKRKFYNRSRWSNNSLLWFERGSPCRTSCKVDRDDQGVALLDEYRGSIALVLPKPLSIEYDVSSWKSGLL